MENNVTIILEDEQNRTTTKEMSAEDFSKMVVGRSTTYNNRYSNIEEKLRKISEAIKLISSKNKTFGGITCLDNYEAVTLHEALYSHQSSVSIPDIVRFDMLSIDDIKNLTLCLKMIKKEIFEKYQLYRIEMVDSEDIFKTISESSIMFFKSEMHYVSGKSTIKYITTSDSMKLKFINVKFFGGYKIGNFADALNEVMNCMPPQPQPSTNIIDDYDGNYTLALI
jgi:hypothetical protein